MNPGPRAQAPGNPTASLGPARATNRKTVPTGLRKTACLRDPTAVSGRRTERDFPFPAKNVQQLKDLAFSFKKKVKKVHSYLYSISGLCQIPHFMILHHPM